MIYFFQYFLSFLGPFERFGILIIQSNEILYGADKFGHALKSAATDSFAGEFVKVLKVRVSCPIPTPATVATTVSL